MQRLVIKIEFYHTWYFNASRKETIENRIAIIGSIGIDFNWRNNLVNDIMPNINETIAKGISEYINQATDFIDDEKWFPFDILNMNGNNTLLNKHNIAIIKDNNTTEFDL